MVKKVATTRSDLVNALTAAQLHQLPHRDVEMVVKVLLGSMAEALAQDQRIEIRGFGSFTITRRPARIGRNPRSGESVNIPEKRVPHFKPGKALRETVDPLLIKKNGVTRTTLIKGLVKN